jgi:hypothetical protein
MGCCAPEVLGPEEIRSYQVYLTNEKKLAPSSIFIAVSALRFLYKVTLHRDWCLEDIIPAPKKPQKLPIVLSPEEVLHFLSCVQSIKHRTILTVCYAAGLRISEAVHLKVADIDSEMASSGGEAAGFLLIIERLRGMRLFSTRHPHLSALCLGAKGKQSTAQDTPHLLDEKEHASNCRQDRGEFYEPILFDTFNYIFQAVFEFLTTW